MKSVRKRGAKKSNRASHGLRETKQIQFWKGDFAKGYIERNVLTLQQLNERMRLYFKDKETFSGMIKTSLQDIPKDSSILEVGCNVGNILEVFRSLGFTNLQGIELNPEVVKIANKLRPHLKITTGSILDIQAPDRVYDVVFTAGVLIHIAPENIHQALSEVVRVSRKYIWGYEYWSPEYEEIPYRGNRNVLWKADFPKLYGTIAALRTKYVRKLPLKEKGKSDVIYLLEK
ncbi:MAG: methyltransferase domain-containing protein [bacterium]|nr:methyltransferase domain-containing protein [bacterium]